MPRARQKQGAGARANRALSNRNRLPSGTFEGEAKKNATQAYGFGGAVLEVGFGVLEAAGLVAAGLGAAADALAG
jgi:hypothetical protein